MFSVKLRFNFSKNKQTQFAELKTQLSEISPEITILDLSSNSLHFLSCPQLLELASLIPPQIKKLCLNNNHLAEKLFYFIPALPSSIEDLDLSHNQLIRFKEEDFSLFTSSFSDNILTLHLDYQDFSPDKIILPNSIEELYLHRVDIFKDNYLKRQTFNHKLPTSIEHIILDETLWLVNPIHIVIDEIPSDIDSLIINLENFQLSDIPVFLHQLPSHVIHLGLDCFFNVELNFELLAMSDVEKISYFSKFPKHIELIEWCGKPIFSCLSSTLLIVSKRSPTQNVGFFNLASVGEESYLDANVFYI